MADLATLFPFWCCYYVRDQSGSLPPRACDRSFGPTIAPQAEHRPSVGGAEVGTVEIRTRSHFPFVVSSGIIVAVHEATILNQRYFGEFPSVFALPVLFSLDRYPRRIAFGKEQEPGCEGHKPRTSMERRQTSRGAGIPGSAQIHNNYKTLNRPLHPEGGFPTE